MRNKTRVKKADFVFLGILISVSLCLFLGYSLFEKSGNTVTVKTDGQVYGTYPLSVNAVIPIGEHNTLVIKNGEAKMEWANCRDQFCVNHGGISRAGQSIVCLPNRVIVTIDGKSETDAIAGCVFNKPQGRIV